MTFAQVLPALLAGKCVCFREKRPTWWQTVEFLHLPNGGGSKLEWVAIEKRAKKMFLFRTQIYALSRFDFERRDWELLEPSELAELFS